MAASKPRIDWCSLVSIQIKSFSPRAVLSTPWASGRRTPPISTTLRPESSRAASRTSAVGSGAVAAAERGVRVAR